jgi:iron complex outermembrane recepter protein
MRFRNRLISSAVAAALGTSGSIVALAQTAGQSPQSQPVGPAQAAQPAQLEEVVVTGIKASLESAQELKKNSDTIQDSIIAEDIGKLPDVTAVEALQRITGVQIGRDLGEGGGSVTIGGSSVNSGIEIRGLPQVETTLNGREVFSATGSRVLNFEDIPSSLLAGIDVYKDPTADLLEGGIGGTVDLRTRKPFDFKGFAFESSAAEDYSDMVGQTKPEFTLLASDRWQTGVGEVGALVSFGYQDRAYRQDQVSNQSILTNTNVLPGQTATLIDGTYNTLFVGERKRIGLDGVLQWQPSDDLQTYAEVSSQELTSKQSQYTFTSYGNANVVPGSTSFFPGTADASSVTYSDAEVGSVGAWRQVVDVNRQYALNAKWTPGAWTVVGDVSYVTGYESLDNPAVLAGGVAPLLTQSVGLGGLTSTAVTGLDMTNLNNLSTTPASFYSYMYDTDQHFHGDEKAIRLDTAYSLDNGFLSSLQLGIRFADRVAELNQASMFGPLGSAEFATNPQWFGLVPGSPLMASIGRSGIQPDYTVFNPQVLRYNVAQVIDAYSAACGTTCGLTQPVDTGASDYTATEKNYTAYFRANFGWDIGVPMDGNIGVRVVRHEDFLYGHQSNSGVISPDYYSNGETDPLPSLNLRFKLTDKLQARFAASKAVTYPDFSQIAPTQTLNAAQGLATGGNPNLKPTKADQVDGSIEYYFAPAASVTFDVFYKKLTDFVLQVTQQDAFFEEGREFNLTGAFNGPSGSIRGAEIGYSQFLDFLPSFWSGIGYQLNYTYVDAQAPTAVAGSTTTLPGLSKNNFNVIGIYEKGPVSFRAAYTWRSQFYTSIYAGSTAQVASNPIFTKQFGWLDASLSYELNHEWTVYVQGSNLLRTRLVQFYGTQTIPESYTINDRQALLGVRFKFN